VESVEGSLSIRDGTEDVIHKENIKGNIILFSTLKATLPSWGFRMMLLTVDCDLAGY
jgi:hypothetical protein